MAELVSTENISPTAHYTGYVWYKNGLGMPDLVTNRGRIYYNALRPFDQVTRLVTSGLSIEAYLLQRHKIIDHLLEQHITNGKVKRVVECACGLSPRGTRFARKFPRVQYYETDLVDMINLKSSLLDQNGLRQPNQQTIELDVLKESGANSMDDLAKSLKGKQGVGVITEGLIGYFDRQRTELVWTKIAKLMKKYPGSVYLSDMHIEEFNRGTMVEIFRRGLASFVGSDVMLMFKTQDDVITTLKKCGFKKVTMHDPGDYVDTLGVPRMERSVLRLIECQV